MKRGKVESVQKLWLNKDEAMAYLGCSVDYLDKLRNNAQVSFDKDGKMRKNRGVKFLTYVLMEFAAGMQARDHLICFRRN